MARKSKDKEVTADDAMELARKELLPFWVGSGPLFAGVREGGRARIFPVSSQFSERNYLLILTDPSCASSAQTLAEAAEFHERFSPHGLVVVVCLRASYSFLLKPGLLEVLAKKGHWQFGACLDPDGALAEALGAGGVPFVALIEKGKVLETCERPDWTAQFEPLLHRFLRSNDPGLALPMPYKSPRGWCIDVGGFELKGAIPDDLQVSGHWSVEGDLRSTRDPKATIQFRLPAEGLSVVAQSMDPTFLPVDIVVEVNGKPSREAWAGRDLERDEAGQSVLRVGQPRAFLALEDVAPSGAQITLRFPYAHRAPVGIFGVRFHRGG